jgi:hypothetical protein
MGYKVHPLRSCLEEFEKTALARHSRVPDFEAIEAVGSRLRDKQNPLAFEDLRELFHACHQGNWWFDEYWEPPQKQGVLGLSFPLRDFDRTVEEQGIEELLSEIKNIEVVSIILRFVRPDSYGILSPPVQRVLNVSWGSNATKTYLNFLENLRQIRRRVGFDRVADVDMALWVLHAKCFGGEQGSLEFRKYYTSDPFLLRLRAKNLISPFRDLPPSVFTRSVRRVRRDLAVVMACYLFEIAVRAKARDLGCLWKGANPLSEVLIDLKKRRKIDPLTLDRWYKMKEVRTNLFHFDRKPTSAQTQKLLNEIEAIERSLPNIRLSQGKVL